jgi:Ser/Thr protein kinase RdoA (MazF antagonist)
MTMARQSGLTFVPAVFPTEDQASAVEHTGRLWELSEWMPGHPDFHQHPSPQRLERACTALAQLHTVWRSIPGTESCCPALERRLEFVKEWQGLLRSDWHPLKAAQKNDPLFPIVERAWQRLSAALDQLPNRLQRWTDLRFRLQPCLCDVWHDHLLFEGDQLTGLIDYGAIKIDNVAVDLARMLGSLVRSDSSLWRAGLQAYRRHVPLSAQEEALAHELDETGIMVGVANWLRWLYEERRSFADRGAVAQRLLELVTRLESLP